MDRDPVQAARGRLEIAENRLREERRRVAELRDAVATVARQLEARGLAAEEIPAEPPPEAAPAGAGAGAELVELHAAAGTIEDAASRLRAHRVLLETLLERLAARAGADPDGAQPRAVRAPGPWRTPLAVLGGAAAGALIMAFVLITPPEKEKAGATAASAAIDPATATEPVAVRAEAVAVAVATVTVTASPVTTAPPPPVPTRIPPPLASFGADDFRTALKIGHGTWTWEAGAVGVYSWSYGLPGIQIFGRAGSGGVLEARMKHSGSGDHQGLAFCFETPSGDCHVSGGWLVRYYLGRFELADRIGTGGTVVASSRPIAIPIGGAYVVRMRVVDGRGVAATLDGSPLLEHVAAASRRGRFAFVAANGEFTFAGVRYAIEDPER